MGKRKLNKCILIVCEGTNTEYDYFRFIKEYISIPNNIWDRVEVSHNSIIPNDVPIPSNAKLGIREKRQFLNPNKHKANAIDVLKELYEDIYGKKEKVVKYEDIKAVPLRYVVQAQLIEQKQQIYEELWAVFDKNGHTHHEEAFQKAKEKINNKIVNIGFSSRSFEQWILLHFEKSNFTFQQTECGERPKNGKKRKGKKSFNCGKNEHEKDCNGKNCLVGYIRINTPLKNYAKSNNQIDLKKMMDILLEKKTLKTAFSNAEWLRERYENKGKIYELNPYTNVDVLVKKLLGI